MWGRDIAVAVVSIISEYNIQELLREKIIDTQKQVRSFGLLAANFLWQKPATLCEVSVYTLKWTRYAASSLEYSKSRGSGSNPTMGKK